MLVSAVLAGAACLGDSRTAARSSSVPVEEPEQVERERERNGQFFVLCSSIRECF